jgi:hypothetical protein
MARRESGNDQHGGSRRVGCHLIGPAGGAHLSP